MGGATQWTGTVTKASTGNLTTPFVSTSCCFARQITEPPEKFGIRNLGIVTLIVNSGAANISVLRIGT